LQRDGGKEKQFVQTNIQKFLRQRKKEIHRQLKHPAADPEILS
jgi:hypothetical protein